MLALLQHNYLQIADEVGRNLLESEKPVLPLFRRPFAALMEKLLLQ
jgi:hypothetical protein